MSTFKAEVVRIGIEPHPNADRLEVATVRGWSCVVVKGQFKSGDLAIYVPLDAVLPEGLIKAAGIEKYYSKRLRTQKLRGVVSQGLVVPISLVDVSECGDGYSEGVDVTERLGITKYDPPIPVHMAGEVRAQHPLFAHYTDIENIKNYPGVLVDGEMVVITEKIHGTNFRAGKFDGELHVGSHNLSLKENKDNLYWRAAEMLGLGDKLREGEMVFGEVYGSGVQDLAYGKKPGDIGVLLFDAYVDGKYLDAPMFVHFLVDRGWEGSAVPVLWQGEWDRAKALNAVVGNSVLCPGQMMEGCVIRPMKERWDKMVGRVILKSINDEYLCRKDATERH